MRLYVVSSDPLAQFKAAQEDRTQAQIAIPQERSHQFSFRLANDSLAVTGVRWEARRLGTGQQEWEQNDQQQSQSRKVRDDRSRDCGG